MSFSVGQRWVSQTEPKLGLGIITESTNRRVTISYPAAGEPRTYASDNAPISRVTYKTGDTISDHEEQQYIVRSLDESGDLIQYHVLDMQGNQHTICEVDLNCFIQFTSPLQRLISGHYDRNRAFRLRYQTLLHKHRLQQSSIGGLLGSRTNLLAHQVYIADKVSQRYSPRVLLADEVGLGKTIEAGMILHAQLHNGLANRVLIVVPSTLVHQWLVEMLRRFNLHFSIFDLERYNSLLEEGINNPFETEQLILCSQDFLVSDPKINANAVDSAWDLLVVDEAHHLQWTESESSQAYQCIEALANISYGVLLLTATPEQAGLESHFARLRLLDPDRFHSLPKFVEQEQHYAEVSSLVSELQAQDITKPLPKDMVLKVTKQLGNGCEIDFTAAAESSVANANQQLLDQHGTGRILFRNTRQNVEGFSKRILHPYFLDGLSEEGAALKSDPRLIWLIDFLKSNRTDKILIICSSPDIALTLESHLRLKEGMLTAVFYEGLSIIERDRAAAWFADKEEGAQALVCSEIGSEGRNFQFAHQLVLFDLPDNPDLLEQRIGRLDRIGQTEDIKIHVPVINESKQHGLFNWYDQALDAFTHSCSAGYAIYDHFKQELASYLERTNHSDDQAQEFISRARKYRDNAMAALHSGRDPLLELNSCNPEIAQQLIEQISSEEQSQALSSYMALQFDLYGVEQETQSDQTLIIHPGDHMLTQNFPGLGSEGKTLTFHRLKALAREDIEFITWEHPMVCEAMEQVLSSELGNAALATMSVQGVQAGTLFLEAVFALNSMAPKALQLDRFLPVSPQRIVVNLEGRNLSDVLPHEKLNELCSGLRRSLAHSVIKEIRKDIPTLLEHAQGIAEQAIPEMVTKAKHDLNQKLGEEIHRLRTLQNKNSLIRDEEISFLQNQQSQCIEHIEKTGLEVNAMRLIINT